MSIELKAGERIDNTGFGNIRVIQKAGFAYGVDAVLLAAFAAGETGANGIKKNSLVIDLGTDCGVVAFTLAHKIPGSRLLGVDIREDSIDRAKRACELNELCDRMSFVQAEVNGLELNELNLRLSEAGGQLVDSAELMKAGFDAVVSNPPYFRKGAAIPNGNEDKFLARHETTAVLRDFVETAARLLGKGGDFYMVHRPDRLSDIFCELRRAGLEPKAMQLVIPRPGEAANIVLIHAVKGAGPELKLLAEIPVHNADGSYSEVIQRLYERE